MLTEHQINALAERAYQRISVINTEYLESVGKTLGKIGELRPSDVHKLQQIYDYSGDIDKIIRNLEKASAKNAAEIYEIFDIVAKENYDFAEPFYKAKGIEHVPYTKNKKLQDYVHSLAQQTVNEYVNLSQHTAFAVFAKDGKSIAPLFEANKNKLATSLSDTYTNVVDYAVSKVQMGLADYRMAMKEVIKAMAASGIKTVDYATGYKRRLDTAVRQNILWGIKQCNQNVADFVGEEFGADGYEISYHSNPRPSHEDMGGRQYAQGKARTVDGVHYPSFEEEAEPLLNDYNCLHFKFPILLGISNPTYSEEQLLRIKKNDGQTFEFEGEEYTRYEGTQLQRQIETSIRHHKDIANMAKAAGEDDLRREAQYQINLLADKYDKLADESGLPTKMDRMQVPGFRSVKAKRTTEGQAKYKALVNKKVDEKQYKKYINILGAENLPSSLDEFQKIKYMDIQQWDDIKYYVKYKGDRPIQCVKIDRELKKLNIKNGNCYPNDDDIVAYILPDHRRRDPYHIMKRMKERGVTDDEVRHYKESASFVMVQWNGKRREYFSRDGNSIILQNDDNWLYRTTWDKECFDEQTLKIWEVYEKYEF